MFSQAATTKWTSTPRGRSCSQKGYLASRGGRHNRWHSLVNCDHSDSTTSRFDSPTPQPSPPRASQPRRPGRSHPSPRVTSPPACGCEAGRWHHSAPPPSHHVKLHELDHASRPGFDVVPARVEGHPLPHYRDPLVWRQRRAILRPAAPHQVDEPARPFPPSIFLDKNRRDIGKSQSIWNRFQDGNGRLTEGGARTQLQPLGTPPYRARGTGPPPAR
jgi:hypothetical protein